MSVRPHIATKYEAEFEEIGCMSADEFVEKIRYIQTEYEQDVIRWEDEHENCFELDAGALQELLDAGELSGDVDTYHFIRNLLDRYDSGNDFIRIELF